MLEIAEEGVQLVAGGPARHCKREAGGFLLIKGGSGGLKLKVSRPFALTMLAHG
jgi:hypothetical protein